MNYKQSGGFRHLQHGLFLVTWRQRADALDTPTNTVIAYLLKVSINRPTCDPGISELRTEPLWYPNSLECYGGVVVSAEALNTDDKILGTKLQVLCHLTRSWRYLDLVDLGANLKP